MKTESVCILGCWKEKTIKKRIFIFLSVFLVLALVCTGAISCRPSETVTEKATTQPAQLAGKGALIGIVTDEEANLAPDVKPQRYSGASIRIHQAVATGTYRLGETCPENTSYNIGDPVTEVISGNDGKWQVELPAGMYFIRAFYGERSYSGDILVEIRDGAVTEVTLKLIHGV
ncbi:MAG: hypothetical protein JXA46_19980 [Dehalococcoidales bacterium]|nr:hypothetical protein [Dehalococcoidales bacterium]